MSVTTWVTEAFWNWTMVNHSSYQFYKSNHWTADFGRISGQTRITCLGWNFWSSKGLKKSFNPKWQFHKKINEKWKTIFQKSRPPKNYGTSDLTVSESANNLNTRVELDQDKNKCSCRPKIWISAICGYLIWKSMSILIWTQLN